MTYNVLARRAAQMDHHQTTQMTHQLQLGGAGGIRPPSQRTLLGHSEGRDFESMRPNGPQQSAYWNGGAPNQPQFKERGRYGR